MKSSKEAKLSLPKSSFLPPGLRLLKGLVFVLALGVRAGVRAAFRLIGDRGGAGLMLGEFVSVPYSVRSFSFS